MVRPVSSFSRKHQYVALPVAGGVGVAVIAWIAGAWPKTVSRNEAVRHLQRGEPVPQPRGSRWRFFGAVTAGVLGGLACARWNSGFSGVLRALANYLKGATDAQDTALKAAWNEMKHQGRAERNDAFKAFRKDHGEALYERLVAGEVKAFQMRHSSSGATDIAAKEAVETLSAPGLRTYLSAPAADLYDKSIYSADPQVKLERLAQAQKTLHPALFDALLRRETEVYRPIEKTPRERSRAWISGLLLASAGRTKGEVSDAGFALLTQDALGELREHGLEGWDARRGAAYLSDLEKAARSGDHQALRLVTADEYEHEANRQLAAFEERWKLPADRPPVDLLQTATVQLCALAVEKFTKQVVRQAWDLESENADVLDFATARREVEKVLAEGVLPRDKTQLHRCLTEVMAEDYLDRSHERGEGFRPLQPEGHVEALGAEVVASVQMKLAEASRAQR